MTRPNFTMDAHPLDYLDSQEWADIQKGQAIYNYEQELRRDELSSEEIQELWDDENLKRWEDRRNEG